MFVCFLVVLVIVVVARAMIWIVQLICPIWCSGKSDVQLQVIPLWLDVVVTVKLVCSNFY